MKHFFPFLTITLILCVLLHNSSILSVSAQQHNSFASAKSLSLDHSVSISLPANATEYYYFSSLQSRDHTDQKYQLTLSKSDSLSVLAYDDQGSPVNLKQADTTTSYWAAYIDNIINNTRFFLVLHNQTDQDVSLHLSVKLFHSATTAPKSDSGNTKKAAITKTDQKSKPTPDNNKTTTQKTRDTSASKTKNTRKNQGTSKQNSIAKHAATQNSKGTSKLSSSTKATTPNNQATTQPTPYYSNHPINHSRSNSILSTHFFRMSVGYSISAFKLLPLNLSDNNIILETMSPEKLSLQNNIIYAKSPGLAVIKIYFDNDITSCTIYIQESQEGRN